MTDQDKPEPAIDPREVARLARDLFIAGDDHAADSIYPRETFDLAARWLRAEQTYLAEHKIPSAEDPRDAEIRELKLDKDTLVRNWIVALGEIAKLSEQADHWRRRALAAESKLVEAPKPAEPTRIERLVRFARDARALKLYPMILSSRNATSLSIEDAAIDPTEAAAMRAALEEKADG